MIELLTRCKGDELAGLQCAVTGGCGFVGSYLVAIALRAGAKSIVVLDIRSSSLFEELVGDNHKVKYVKCDIRDEKEVLAALKGVDVVFHTVGYFGNPAFTRTGFNDTDRVFDINVGGTESLLKASIANGVKRFIYTSSVNVVFNGLTHIENGDEKQPYPEHIDPYGASKAKAEQLVIAANGKNNLLTCALRPNGIYGPADVTISKSLTIAKSMGGIFFRTATKADFTYVENIAYANILAAVQLAGKPTTVGGQCYNITDGVPVEIFAFMKDFVVACGCMHKQVIPMPNAPLLYTAIALEWLSMVSRPVFRWSPMMSSVEARKLLRSNYFDCSKAMRDLQYKPLNVSDCKAATAAYYKQLPQYAAGSWLSARMILIIILIGVILYFL